jgi:hypothetical protein
MGSLVLHFRTESTQEPCQRCGQLATLGAGACVLDSSSLQPVCSGCTQREAPALAALLDLAREAERVGRISHHNHHRRLWVPMEALLALTRVAEKYFAVLSTSERAA